LRNARPDLFQSSFPRTFTNPAPNESEKLKSASLAWKKWILVRAYLGSINWKGLWEFLLGSGAIFLAGDLIYLGWMTLSNERRVNKTLEKGTQPETETADNELILRPEVTEHLKKIFQPVQNHSYYHVVCGEHGTGKTTLTTKVAREIGKGVIYVDTPADIEEFGNSFGKALNLIFDEDTMLTLRLKRNFFGDTKGESVIIVKFIIITLLITDLFDSNF